MTSAVEKRRERYRFGHRAETRALLCLMMKGYMPVARRYKTPVGEIDLIVRRGRTLVFVEVKARRTRDEAAFAIHARNQLRVVQAAQMFISTYPNYTDWNMRFDAIMVAWYRWPHHITHAFE